MVVLIEVHLHIEIPARQVIEILSVRVESRVDIVIEIVRDCVDLVLFETVELYDAVLVIVNEAVGKPFAVR